MPDALLGLIQEHFYPEPLALHILLLEYHVQDAIKDTHLANHHPPPASKNESVFSWQFGGNFVI
jgi:hypothetical protein